MQMLKKQILGTLVFSVGIYSGSSLFGNILVNPNFNMGADNLDGYEAFAEWFQPSASAGFGSAWGLADAPVTADGGGTAVFGMNTQLAAADPFWTGATQTMTIQQNFWTPDNNAGVTPTTNLYNQILTFSGIAQVTEPYAPGNLGEVFIQFLDQAWNAVGYFPADVSLLGPSGEFEIMATAPASGLNIIQVGFRNSGIEGTAGQMTVSDLSLTAIPEPSTYALILAGAMALLVFFRRRK